MLASADDVPTPPDTIKHSSRAFAFASGGAAAVQVGALNSLLTATGYPTFTSTVPSVGGGGLYRVGDRLLLGAEGHAYVWGGGRAQTGRSVALQGGYALVTAGYAVSPLSSFLPALRVYPLVGVGGGALRVEVSGPTGNFAAALESPRPGLSLQRWNVVVSAAAAADYRVLAGTPLHFRVGLQGGFAAVPAATDWYANRARVPGGPDATLGGPFVRLFIGRTW